MLRPIADPRILQKGHPFEWMTDRVRHRSEIEGLAIFKDGLWLSYEELLKKRQRTFIKSEQVRKADIYR